MESGNLAEWVTGAATTGAVVVALFQNPIRGYWSRPKLRVSLRLGSPDCDKTKLRMPITWEEPYVHQPVVDGYNFRLWVENEGNTRAEEARVFAAELYQEALDETLHRVENFLPQNFTWSHLRNNAVEVFAEGLSQHMCLLLELAYSSFVENHSNNVARKPWAARHIRDQFQASGGRRAWRRALAELRVAEGEKPLAVPPVLPVDH